MSERTEAPTPRRREEARRKGQVARSVEINSAIVLLASFWLLNATGSDLVNPLRVIMRRSFETLPTVSMMGDGAPGTGELTLPALQAGALPLAGLTAQVIVPLLLLVMLAGVVANLSQVGLMFTFESLRPDFKRVNPVTGFGRLFSGRGLIELIKSLLKLAIIGFLVYTTLRDNFPTIAAANRMPLPAAVTNLAQLGVLTGLHVAVVLLVIAAVDYLFQRREFEKSLRMTRQELIEEFKRNENPQLKSRIRSRQRQLAMKRMMAAVPKADVIITNPTHFAVALLYEKGKMRAPQVVAKGERLVAERIKAKAREHNVPLVENKWLARTLFKSAEIGREIPLELYQAVAEVLAFVYRLKSERISAGA